MRENFRIEKSTSTSGLKEETGIRASCYSNEVGSFTLADVRNAKLVFRTDGGTS